MALFANDAQSLGPYYCLIRRKFKRRRKKRSERKGNLQSPKFRLPLMLRGLVAAPQESCGLFQDVGVGCWETDVRHTSGACRVLKCVLVCRLVGLNIYTSCYILLLGGVSFKVDKICQKLFAVHILSIKSALQRNYGM